MFLQCPGHGPSIGKRATFVFYATCLLYPLCTVNFVGDLAVFIFEVSNNSTCSKNIVFLISSAGEYRDIAFIP